MNLRRALTTISFILTLTIEGVFSAQAATFNVDTTIDDAALMACDDARPDDCSLRGAILAANARSEASTINMPAGTYVLSQSSTCTFRIKTSSPGIFTSSQIPLCLSKQITIQGAGAASTIIDGDRRGRVLFVSADAVAEVRGVTLKNGNGGASFFSSQNGGGIQNHGMLTLTETVVSNNTLSASTSRGAGIANFGVLTLLRSAVVNNASLLGSEAGGGIYNEGFFSGSVLTVSDSTISGNTIASHGGGIFNEGTATIINSTISGNTTNTGFGGGITNLHGGASFTARLTAINSTISGNTSGTAGGGIFNGFITTTHLNNVTITKNTAGTSSAASRSGGGINNNGPSDEFTLQNTIIAGNRDLGLVPAPDCFSEPGNGTPLTSQGYNLVQNTTGCVITGDTTGNLTGVDPQLGSLLDNGGPTKTHALAADSPALDVGNPAGPGSGGTACAALDQRGFNRLQDGDQNGVGRCDIGAFELAESAVGFSFSGLRPNAAGNVGSTYALLYGSGFVNGMTVRLTRAGAPDIVGAAVTVSPGGAVAATSFDLTGQATGLWDLVVTNPGESPTTLANAFKVEEGGAPQLWADVLGPSRIRVGRPTRFTLLFGNRGNIDAVGAPLVLGIPRVLDFGLNFSFASPPHAGQVPTNWNEAAFNSISSAYPDFTMIPLFLPLIPAGSNHVLEFTITAPQEIDGQNFQILFGINAPYFTPTLDAQIVDEFIDTARTYAEQHLGAVIPLALIPGMKQYLTTQLQSEVTRGRTALVEKVSASFEVYNLSHLLLDVAQFGVAQAAVQTSQAQTQTTGWKRLTSLAWRIIAAVFEPSVAHATCEEEGGKWKTCSGCTQPICCKTIGCCALLSCPKLPPPPCAGESCKPGSGSGGGVIGAYDPNDKLGSRGAGTAQFLAGGEPLRYTILFENVETATAAAQEVIITDQLDYSKVDLDTFSLGPISFGEKTIVPPPGLSSYNTSVDLRPANNLLVGIDARLDKSTGLITWRFTSIDPLTGQFTEDPLAGFLPPNVTPPEGDGSVVFTVKPKVTGTPICNRASIVFDVNDPILTPQWCNTIDNTPPSSAVQSLSATQASPDFTVQWAGSDQGAGLESYSIFVSENDGPFTAFLTDTTNTSALFPGVAGNSYAFYSIARDLVGNIEAAPHSPDTQTTVGGVAMHDLAVTDISAPPIVTLTDRRAAQTKAVKVQIQNRSPHLETIPDAAVLTNLVSLELASLGGCLVSPPVLSPPKKFPLTLKPKQKLSVGFAVTFACANNASKGAGQEDYRLSARVDHTALGSADTHPADDVCPRSVTPPFAVDPHPDNTIKDKGCGEKKADKTFGDPVLVDVVVKP